MNYKTFVFLPVFFFALLVFAPAVSAAEREWNPSAPGNLASAASNWQGGVLPSSGDDVVLPAGSTISWDMPAVVPNNFTTGANLTLVSPLAITGTLKVTSGTVNTASNAVSVGGSLLLTGGAVNFGASSVNVGGDWTFSGGSADLAAVTVSFIGGGAKTIVSEGKHFGLVNINASGSVVTFGDDFYGDGLLTVSGGTLNDGGRMTTLMGGIKLAGGEFVSSGTLNLGGTAGKPFVSEGGNFVAQAGAKTVYSAASGSVTVAPLIYRRLELVGKAVFSLSGALEIQESLFVGVGTTLSLGGHALSIPSGNLENDGTILGSGGINMAVGSVAITDASGAVVSGLATTPGTLKVRVSDKAANRKGDTSETLSGIVLTTLSGDREMITASETSLASGEFLTAAIVVHQGTVVTGNGQLEVGQNDIIFVAYTDPDAPSRTRSAQINVSAAAADPSGAPQIVSGPILSDWSSTGTANGAVYSAHIVWTTDIPSTSSVAVSGGNLLAPITAGNLAATVSHDVAVTGLARSGTYSYKVSSMSAEGKTTTSEPQSFVVIVDGDRIKTSSSPAVYWYLSGKRNVFPNFTAYDSWFPDWEGIVTVPDAQMASIALGSNVPVRAGTYLLKIQSDPRVYAVEPLGRLRWIQNETQARSLYGTSWSKRVADMDVAFFASYSYGDPLSEGKLPEGYLYTSGNEVGVYLENSLHKLPAAALELNGVSNRFINAPAPAVFNGINDGAVYFGYSPAFSQVYASSGKTVSAPAR